MYFLIKKSTCLNKLRLLLKSKQLLFTNFIMALIGMDSFSAPRFWHNGPAPGALYNFPAVPTYSEASESQRTTQPTVIGASVLGVKFDGGVLLSADMLCSYGSMARYRDCQRILKINNNIVLGCSGDYADYQYLKNVIEQKIIDDENQDDGFNLKPKAMYNWLTRVLYNRRSKMNPLWVQLVIAGMEDGEPFLGTVDKLGTAYVDNHIATGFGSYIALPLMREAYEKTPQMSLPQAKKLLVDSMQTLFYRDARSFPKYSLGVVTAEGVQLEGPLFLESDWSIAHMVKEES